MSLWSLDTTSSGRSGCTEKSTKLSELWASERADEALEEELDLAQDASDAAAVMKESLTAESVNREEPTVTTTTVAKPLTLTASKVREFQNLDTTLPIENSYFLWWNLDMRIVNKLGIKTDS